MQSKLTFFLDQEWKTVGRAKRVHRNNTRKRPFAATSAPTRTLTQTSNRYASLTTDDEHSDDSIDDIPDFMTFLTRVKKRRRNKRESSSSDTDTPSFSSDSSPIHRANTKKEADHEGKTHSSTEFKANSFKSEYFTSSVQYSIK